MFNVDVILRKSLKSSGNLLPRSLIDVNKRSGYEISLIGAMSRCLLFVKRQNVSSHQVNS